MKKLYSGCLQRKRKKRIWGSIKLLACLEKPISRSDPVSASPNHLSQCGGQTLSHGSSPEPPVGQPIPAEATLLHSSFILSLLLSSPPLFKFMNPILLMGKLRHGEVKDFPKRHTACKGCTLDSRLFDSKHWATTLHFCTDLFIYIIYLTSSHWNTSSLRKWIFVLFSPQLYPPGSTEVWGYTRSSNIY